jgi:glycolate oxidase
MTDSAKQKLKSIVGSSNYFDSSEDRMVYSYDGTPTFHQMPEAVVFPTDEQQISDIIKLANEDKFAVVPRGAGTGLSGGSVPVENSIVIVLTKWNKILEVDDKNLTAWVQPGL